jgi:hypothetical protein
MCEDGTIRPGKGSSARRKPLRGEVLPSTHARPEAGEDAENGQE